MEKPQLQFVFAPHGKFDSDAQDEMFDHTFPAFFKKNTFNVFGLEDAGTYTDENRDKIFESSQKDPSNPLNCINSRLSSSDKKEYNFFSSVKNYLECIFTTRGPSSLIMRQRLILTRWNLRNPEAPVFPFVESFQTEDEKNRFNKLSDNLAVEIKINGNIRWFYEYIADILKEKDDAMSAFLSERDDNWVRILGDLLKKVRDVREKVRILLNLGTSHSPLSQKVRNAFGNDFEILPDIFIPSKSNGFTSFFDEVKNEYVRDHCVSNEKYIRGVFFECLLNFALRAVPQKASSFYSMDPEFLADLRNYALTVPFEYVLKTLNFSDENEILQDTDGEVLKCRPADETTLNDVPNDIKNSIKNDQVLTSRENHPNNIYIDKTYILACLCNLFEISEKNDGCVKLLQQVIKKVAAKDINNLYRLRQEFYFWQTQNCHINVDDIKSIFTVINVIAKQDPQNSSLWSDSTRNFKAGCKLVAKARNALRKNFLMAL